MYVPLKVERETGASLGQWTVIVGLGGPYHSNVFCFRLEMVDWMLLAIIQDH